MSTRNEENWLSQTKMAAVNQIVDFPIYSGEVGQLKTANRFVLCFVLSAIITLFAIAIR